MLNLLKHELISRGMTAFWWGIGLFLFGTTYLLIYPGVEEQLTALADWSIYKAMGFDMGSFEGFIASNVVLVIPLILGIYVIIASTSTLAGEEEDGTLELLLAMPLHRWQIVTAKAIAIGLTTLVILLIAGIGNGIALNWVKTQVEVDVTTSQLIIAVINGWPLTLVFVMMGLFLGAFMPNQKTATITLTVIFIVSYLSENFANHIDSLNPIKPYSLFTYFDTSSKVFQQGVQSKDVVTLFVVAAVFYVLTLIGFQQRNVTVGSWPWQKGKDKKRSMG